MRPARLAALSLALILAAASAWAGPGSLTLRASTGLSDADLGGWNRPLLDFSNVAAMNYDPLGPSLRSQVELSWRPVSAFSLGVAGSFQKVESRESFEYTGFTSIEDRTSISLQRITGRLAWWPAFLPGAYIGEALGSATAKAEETFVIEQPDGTTYTYRDDWSDSRVIFGLFAGAERQLTKHGLLGFVELGWDFQPMGQLGDSRYDRSSITPVLGSAPDAPPIHTDFSGAHLMFGLAWSLGRHD